MSDLFCIRGGHLVDAVEWLPTDPWDYDWGARSPRIGCSNVRCSACGSRVRSFRGRRLPERGVAPAREIFELADWEHAAQLVESPGGRVYACACLVHVQLGVDALEPDFTESSHPLELPWRCQGHTPLPLPGELDGIAISSTMDFDALATTTLSGRAPAHHPAWKPLDPAYWLVRLYALAAPPPFRLEIADAVGRALDHDDPRVRRGAIKFFRFHPLTRGAARLANALATARDRFDGVADPDDADSDLGEYLRTAIEARLALRDASGAPLDPAAYAAARTDVLAGRGGGAFILAVVHDDPAWAVQHVATIVAAAPDQLGLVLLAFRDEPVAVAVDAVTAIVRAGAATPDAVRAKLRPLWEPHRAAMLAAVDAAQPPG